MSTSPFLGLTLPVFNAFGFMGEETAVKYALEQMEQFVLSMHTSLSREAQTLFPNRGLDRASECAYLARSLEVERDLNITFHLKPMAMRMAINITDRTALAKAFKALQSKPDQWNGLVAELGEDWELRLQQMEYNPETEVAAHYKDVFKDRLSTLTPEKSAEVIDRMVYLNSEEKWLGPLYLTRRMPSEFVAAMGTNVVNEMANQLIELMPLLRLLAGGLRGGTTRAKPAGSKTTKARKRSRATSASKIAEAKIEEFTYNAKLKPLHIRKGFVNMTSAHWPFFAINSRTETRAVTLKFDGHVDKESAVWRLVPDDTARLVLSDKAHSWLEDNFSNNDEVQVRARKHGPKEIEIELALVQ